MSQLRMTEEQFAARLAKNAPSKVDLLKLDTPSTKIARPSKYGNKKTVIDGIEFDSKREARRYQDLALMQKAGQITELRRQVPFRLEVNGVHICDYICDFQYRRVDSETKALGETVCEDSKGCATPEFRLKRKLMLGCHGIKVFLT